MAVTLALTSFSCSVPFLALMFEDFNAGGHLSAAFGLTVYGGVVAAPFMLCSLFPAAISALPRAGVWMNAIKVTMGFVEFALAFKFLRTVALTFHSDVLPRGFVLAIWAACALGAALYLLGFVVLPHDTRSESIGVVRLVVAFALLYLLPGVFRQPLANWIEAFLQTNRETELAAAGDGHGGAAHIEWTRNDWDGALLRAAQTRPLLMDFTGVG
jgi:thiol:disulfide interchange protein DsbD